MDGERTELASVIHFLNEREMKTKGKERNRRPMGKGKNWEKEKAVIIDVGIMAAIISVIVLIAYQVNGIYPFGDETIARGDMVQQTIPAGMYYVWDILHGDASPFFTWNSAYGINISGASSLGAFLSPLNLFLYFSTRDNLVNFVNILLILKMIAIACAMYVYLKKYEIENVVRIIGGVLYAFGAASLIHFQIIFVMDAAFLLPLLMIGIDRILNKKGCKFFILLFALTMITNVYTGCITLIFLFLSCGTKLFFEMNDQKEKYRCSLQLGVSVGAAVLLSAVVSIPAFLCIAGTSRSGDGNFLNTYLTAIQNGWSISEWKTVERMIVNMALPCAAILFFSWKGSEHGRAFRKKYRSHIVMLVFMILSVAVSGTELLWHGGTRALWPIRFIYVISFVLIDFAVVLYKENKQLVKGIGNWLKGKIVYAVAGAAALISGWIFYGIYDTYCKNEAYGQLGDGFLCIFIELFCAGLFWCFLKGRKKELILVLLCVQMTFTSIISFAPNKDNVTVFSPEYLKAASEVATSMETEIGDFERIKNTDYKVDHIEYSLVLGAEAISNYWHVIPSELQANFAALGYTINWTQLLDTGGTVFTDTLFQTKYFLSQYELPEELYDYCEALDGYGGDVLHLYGNKFELPFAIGTDVPTLQQSGEKFQTQNNLFAAVTGGRERLIEDVSQRVSGSRFDMEVGNDKKLFYFYGTNSNSDPVTISVNGSPVLVPSSSVPMNQQYPADFGNGFIYLGGFQNEHVSIQFSGGGESNIRLGMLDYNTFVNGIETVKKQNPEIKSLKQGNSGLKLELDQVTKPYVFLPVTYDEGWVCKVNGEEVSEIGYMDGMLSIPVKQGANEIVLSYVPDGQGRGAVLSILVLLLLAAVTVLQKKTKIFEEKESKPVQILGQIAYVVFAALFLAVVILLFAVPALYRVRDVWIGSE